MSAAISAVDAHRSTARGLDSIADSLSIEARIRAVAAGKAAVGMARALDDAVGDRLVGGVMTAAGSTDAHGAWQLYPATHPQPSPASEAAGRAALVLADAARADGSLLVACLSGGASAMLAVPAPGLTMADKMAVTGRLLMAGLDIGALNLVRRHLSAIKGGQLAARAGRTMTLAISDVCTPVEDDPAVIGSGPTAGDDTTFADALRLLRTRRLFDDLPPAVRRHLEAGAAGQVDGPVPSSDPRLAGAAYWIVASRQDAMRAAAATARALGYRVHVERPPTTGEARDAARRFLSTADGIARPACLIASGETTVRVVGAGQGGRNQEFAVAALEPLAQVKPAALASIGTDGRDGPTDAAGSFVDGDLWASMGPSARERVERALADNDAYPFLDGLGALVRTGPTGTNVGDLQVLLLK